MKTLLLPVYAEEPGTWTGQCALTSAELSQLLGYLPALTLLQVRLLELQTVGCEEDPMAGVDEMEGGMAPADGAVYCDWLWGVVPRVYRSGRRRRCHSLQKRLSCCRNS